MAAFAIPGDPATPTGGYIYDRKVIDASAGVLKAVRLPGGFPFPSDGELSETAAILGALPGPALIDGLAFGALPAGLIDALPHAPVALCHHPLGLEAGLDAATSRRLIEAERAALARAAHVVVTSGATKRTLVGDLGVAAAKVTVAAPGVDQAPAAALYRETPDTPVILTVASLTPRKAHDVLVAALAAIADRRWRAVWAGPDDRAPDWAARIRRDVARAGLGARIGITGACDAGQLETFYAEAAVFCLPSRYEGYGMVCAEAMMRGLPIAATDTAAAREVMPKGAARLVPTDDAAALAGALAALLDDPVAARNMGARGRDHALTLPGWDATWTTIHAALEASR